MQDSLEDYIQISRNCKEGPTQIKKETLLNAQIKKECDAKAMQIIQFAIEGKMRTDALFRCLPYINRSHYQDIVEERALTKLCGYPLCSKRIPDMPKKQFYISTKNNKVYDITDRKNYCSNFCYRASIHVKNQVDTSPLWLRKHYEKAQFTILNKTEKGLPGELIDQGISKSTPEPVFMSISTFTEMSLDEAEEFELKPEEEEINLKKQVKKPRRYQKNTMKTIKEGEELVDRPENTSEIKEEEKENVRIKEKKSVDNVDVEQQLKKCFKEWFSLETYMFIYGEETVKAKLNEEKLSEFFTELKVAELQIEQQKRYVDICRKLHLKELADEKFDNTVVGSQLKPIPDYKELKEENKVLDVKVKSFYSGLLHEREDVNKKEEEDSMVLPLVDVNSQMALRRKIYMTSLNKTVHTLFQSLKQNPSTVISDLRNLVKTFRLKADNIVFKPQVWNNIVVILLKILTIRDDSLKMALDTDHCTAVLEVWLSPLLGGFVNDILTMLQDVDVFTREYIVCK